MYQSPIELMWQKVITENLSEEKRMENEICSVINVEYGLEVNKEELIKALAYDRDQYNKGYQDGKRDAEAIYKNSRKFIEIVVRYLPDDITYPEYRGKPYFSICYEEDGQTIIGYGTYKPEVLSEYLRDFFFNKDDTPAYTISKESSDGSDQT